jgi:hypothetical protein
MLRWLLGSHNRGERGSVNAAQVLNSSVMTENIFNHLIWIAKAWKSQLFPMRCDHKDRSALCLGEAHVFLLGQSPPPAELHRVKARFRFPLRLAFSSVTLL